MLPDGVSLETALAVLVPIALITIVLRAVPFGVRKSLGSSQLVRLLGLTMPVGVMTVLVVYTLAGQTSAPGGLLPGLLAVAVTLGVHLWLNKPAWSILIGTVFYMVLVNLVF